MVVDRHAPVRDHGGQIYGQADLACDCSDEVVIQSVARVLPKGAIWVSSHLSRARHTAEALWQNGYVSETDTVPPLLAVPELAEQNFGEWQGLDRARFAADNPHLPQAIGMPLPTSARVAAKVLPMFVRASARPWTACLTSFRAAISLQLRTGARSVQRLRLR